jgi:hypothetical protein
MRWKKRALPVLRDVGYQLSVPFSDSVVPKPDPHLGVLDSPTQASAVLVRRVSPGLAVTLPHLTMWVSELQTHDVSRAVLDSLPRGLGRPLSALSALQ